MKVSTLKKNPKNPRQISKDKLELLTRSIGSFQKMMNLRPMIVDENNVVLGGNMRLAAIKALGLKEIPDEWVKQVTDLTEDEKAEFIIKDNNAFGEYDWDAVANEWSDYPLAEWGLDVPGFEAVEPEGDADAEPQIDKAAELNKKWKVKSGDLWQIGEHRLLCGSCTDLDDVTRVMDGNTALVFTDPPYGVSVVKDAMVGADFGIAKKGRYSPIVNDESTDTASMFYSVCKAFGFDRFILWGGNYFTAFLPQSPGWLIWNKRADTGIRNTFADGEMAWTNVQPQVRIYDQLWNGMIRAGESGERMHPTQKPVKVCSDIINDYGIDGEAVFDGFAGSGTTLVACQNLNRKCYAIEISENYCSVILERMQTAFPELEIKRLSESASSDESSTHSRKISENYCAVILERMATAFPDIEIKRIEAANAANG